MTAARPPETRRLPTALVLVAASAMLSIGAVAFFVALDRDAQGSAEGGALDPRDLRPRDVPSDQRTPERAAESWLDAWRVRNHEAALRLSVDVARERVEQRRRGEEIMSPEDRALGEAVWKQLADTRLTLVVRRSEQLEGGRMLLAGTAEGEWMGRPYVRPMEFVMVRRGSDWFVSEYRFLEAERPRFRVPPEGTPGAFLGERPPPPSLTEDAEPGPPGAAQRPGPEAPRPGNAAAGTAARGATP
jgi:hypothetical protein